MDEIIKIWTDVERRLSQMEQFSFEETCQWKSLKEASFDHFRRDLSQSAEYLIFFLRALLGKLESVPVGSILWNESAIEIKNSALVDRLKHKNFEEDVLGADLVARCALVVAWNICNSAEEELFPTIDLGVAHPLATKNDCGHISFRFADFVEGKVKGRPQIYLDNGGLEKVYYQYEWEKTKENGVRNFGWPEDASFINNPYEASEGIQSFLGFPAFFKYDAAQVIFHTLVERLNESEIQSVVAVDSSMKDLMQLGINPYIKFKQADNKDCVSLVLCVGVAAQHAAYFNPMKLETGYGAFFTVDVFSKRKIPADHLEKICKELEICRYQIRYKVLQLLTARLLREAQKQNQELRKFEKMYSKLLGPLKSLSNALDQTQAETQEIRSILYEPEAAIFTLVPQIAKFFEAGDKPLNNPDGSTIEISHKPGEYSVEQKEWVLAHILAKFRGKEIGLDVSTSSSALMKEINHLTRAAKDLTHVYHQYAATILNLIEFSEDVIDPGHALDLIKGNLFTPFKPDEAKKPIQGYILASLLPVAVFKEISSDFKTACILPKGINPFATQGHLLRFISSVISATYNDPTHNGSKMFQLVSCGEGGLVVSKENDRPWISGNAIHDLFVNIRRELEAFIKDWRPAADELWGDRAAPFIRLIRRLPSEYRREASNLEGKDCLSILSSGREVFSCRSHKDGILIRVENLEIRYMKEFYVGTVRNDL